MCGVLQAIAAAQAIAARLSGQSAPVASAPGSYGHQPYSYGTPQPQPAAAPPQQQPSYTGLGPAGQAAASAAMPSWQSGTGGSYGLSTPSPAPSTGPKPFSYDKINSEQLAGRGGGGGRGGGAPPSWQQNSSAQQAYMTGRYGGQQVKPCMPACIIMVLFWVYSNELTNLRRACRVEGSSGMEEAAALEEEGRTQGTGAGAATPMAAAEAATHMAAAEAATPMAAAAAAGHHTAAAAEATAAAGAATAAHGHSRCALLPSSIPSFRAHAHV